jgi:hypothetical protein
MSSNPTTLADPRQFVPIAKDLGLCARPGGRGLFPSPPPGPRGETETVNQTRNSRDMMRLDKEKGLHDGVSYDAIIIEES